jgi:hypothetical protein
VLVAPPVLVRPPVLVTPPVLDVPAPLVVPPVVVAPPVLLAPPVAVVPPVLVTPPVPVAPPAARPEVPTPPEFTDPPEPVRFGSLGSSSLLQEKKARHRAGNAMARELVRILIFGPCGWRERGGLAKRAVQTPLLCSVARPSIRSDQPSLATPARGVISP